MHNQSFSTSADQPRHPIDTSRRHWMRRCGTGFGGLALAQLLQIDSPSSNLQANESQSNHSEPTFGLLPPHFPGKAKHIIHVFLNGGVSQVDTFDPNRNLHAVPVKCFRFPTCKPKERPALLFRVHLSSSSTARAAFPLATCFQSYRLVSMR